MKELKDSFIRDVTSIELMAKSEVRRRLDEIIDQTNQQPIGVSQWKEQGKKYGYWDYFEKQIKEGKDV